MRRVMAILLQEQNFGPNVIYYVFVFLFVHFRHFFGTVSALLRCFVDARGTQRYSPAPSVLFWPPSAFSCGCLLKTKGAAPYYVLVTSEIIICNPTVIMIVISAATMIMIMIIISVGGEKDEL